MLGATNVRLASHQTQEIALAKASSTELREETFGGTGGLKIFFRSWRPAAKPRAIVVICHGVNSHGGQYIWPAEQLSADALVVYAIDLRGRGKSEGDRYYVADIADYVSDIANLVKLAKSRDPGLPVILLGHSAGGVVSCVYALDNQAELAGLICESFAFKGARTRFCAGPHQEAERHSAALWRAEAQEQGFHP